MKLENGFTEKINFYLSGLNLNAFLPWNKTLNKSQSICNDFSLVHNETSSFIKTVGTFMLASLAPHLLLIPFTIIPIRFNKTFKLKKFIGIRASIYM